MASAENRDLCAGCKTYQPVAYTEPETERTFCEQCAVLLPPTTDELALFLITSPLSPYSAKFYPGQVVQCYTAGEYYDGTGTVDAISMNLEHGGTPVYPTFHVVLSDKAHDKAPDDAWYTEVCLRHVKAEATS